MPRPKHIPSNQCPNVHRTKAIKYVQKVPFPAGCGDLQCVLANCLPCVLLLPLPKAHHFVEELGSRISFIRWDNPHPFFRTLDTLVPHPIICALVFLRPPLLPCLPGGTPGPPCLSGWGPACLGLPFVLVGERAAASLNGRVPPPALFQENEPPTRAGPAHAQGHGQQDKDEDDAVVLVLMLAVPSAKPHQERQPCPIRGQAYHDDNLSSAQEDNTTHPPPSNPPPPPTPPPPPQPQKEG